MRYAAGSDPLPICHIADILGRGGALHRGIGSKYNLLQLIVGKQYGQLETTDATWSYTQHRPHETQNNKSYADFCS